MIFRQLLTLFPSTDWFPSHAPGGALPTRHISCVHPVVLVAYSRVTNLVRSLSAILTTGPAFSATGPHRCRRPAGPGDLIHDHWVATPVSVTASAHHKDRLSRSPNPTRHRYQARGTRYRTPSGQVEKVGARVHSTIPQN